MDMVMKRVAVYARVSTQEQAEKGYSIDAQLETLRSISKSLNHTIIEEYVDRGISGKSIEKRPAMCKLLEDVKKGVFDEVVVWKINRLSRNHLDLLNIVNDFDKYDITIRSVTEPFDTSNPSGRLLLNLLASIGEFERETIVDNIKHGMRQRALSGYHNGGRMLGYRAEKVDDGREKSTLKIVPEEAVIIRMIFDLYILGNGYKYITNQLNSRNYKTINGNDFNLQAVRDIIHNPTYAGYVRYNHYVYNSKRRRLGNENELVMVDGEHEGIISKDTWSIVEKRISENTGRHRKTHKGFALLSGLIRCPQCGSSMIIGRVTRKQKNGEKKRYRYYQCCKYKNYGSSVCKANSIVLEEAEEYVINKISDLAFDEKFIHSVVEKLKGRESMKFKTTTDKISQLKKKQQDVECRKEKIFELYEEGIITKVKFIERIKNVDEDYESNSQMINKLERELLDLEKPVDLPLDKIKAILKNLGSILSISSRKQQKIILNLVIDHITLKDKKVDCIHMNVDNSITSILKNESEDSSNEESSFLLCFEL